MTAPYRLVPRWGHVGFDPRSAADLRTVAEWLADAICADQPTDTIEAAIDLTCADDGRLPDKLAELAQALAPEQQAELAAEHAQALVDEYREWVKGYSDA